MDSVLLIVIVTAYFLIISAAILYRKKKELIERIEKIDKGKLLIFKEYKMIDAVPKNVRYFLYLTIIIVTCTLIVFLFVGNSYFIVSMAVLSGIFGTYFSKVRVEVYEKGIVCEYAYIPWKKVKDYEWRDGSLKVKPGKFRTIFIKDEDQKVKSILEEKVKEWKV